jgi:DNA-binding transcriptional LysR family regulator
MRSSEFADLQAFVAVAAALNFSRAAEQLGVTPSALSQAIRRVENRLQLRLFNRSTRSVALTDTGRELLQQLTRVFRELDDVVTAAHYPTGSLTGRVSVNTSRIAAQAYVSPVLASFCSAHPNVEVDIRLEESLVDLIASGCDIGIRMGEKLEQDMIATQLGADDRAVVVASPSYSDRHGLPSKLEDLPKHRCIRFRWPGSGTIYRWEFVAGRREVEIEVAGPVILGDTDLVLRAAADGVGLAYVLRSQARSLLESGKLVQALESYCPTFPAFFLYYFGRQRLQPQVRAFIDAIVKHANG